MITKLLKAYHRKNKVIDTQRKHIEEEIKYKTERLEEIKKEISLLTEKDMETFKKYPYWVKFLIEPLAKELEKLHPECYSEVLGPFGLTSTVSIHIYRKEDDDAVKINNAKSISFRLENEKLKIIDYSKRYGDFPAGSIGAINGCNYGTVECPDSLKEINKYVL